MKAIWIIAIAIGLVVWVFSLPPIAQDHAYHLFADTRFLLGLTNFSDVASNLCFMYFGVKGLEVLDRNRGNTFLFVEDAQERIMWRIFFISSILVGMGSAYYHSYPGNGTLVWDRLPMTFAFMSLFSIIIAEYVDSKLGRRMIFPLMFVGASTVFYWYAGVVSEEIEEDLRPYVLVQFLPIILIALMVLTLPGRYNNKGTMLKVIGIYGLAKLVEHLDHELFSLSFGVVSGHSLKHIIASFAVYVLYRDIERRTPL